MLVGDDHRDVTAVPGTAVRFEFDLEDGRGRGAEFDGIPARASSGGA
jgi:hypothetical protein